MGESAVYQNFGRLILICSADRYHGIHEHGTSAGGPDCRRPIHVRWLQRAWHASKSRMVSCSGKHSSALYLPVRSAEAVAEMISADLQGKEWNMPAWFPEHYLIDSVNSIY